MIGMRLRVREGRRRGEGAFRRKDVSGEGMLCPGAPGLCCQHVGTHQPGGALALSGQTQQSSGGQSTVPITAAGLGFLPAEASLLVPTLPAAREGGALLPLTAQEWAQSAAST